MELLIRILLITHVAAGFTSLGLFFVPAIAKKGSRLHNRTGLWYTYGMWVVIVTAVLLCIFRFYQGNIEMALFLGFLAILTSRPLYHGVAVLRNKKGPSEQMQLINGAIGITLALLSPYILGIGLGWWGPGASQLLLVFGILGCVVTWPAVVKRFVLGKKTTSYNWLEEHVSGMVISAIAAFTAFFAFGGRSMAGDAFNGTVELIAWISPTVLGVAFIRYYKWKTRRKRKSVTGVAVQQS